MMAPSSNTQAQDIEKLRKRFEELNTKRIRAEANLTTSSETLENLKKEAREKYGTDDLASLRKMLASGRTISSTSRTSNPS
jgi:molecular chaperone GrpE (heat shock protein)